MNLLGNGNGQPVHVRFQDCNAKLACGRSWSKGSHSVLPASQVLTLRGCWHAYMRHIVLLGLQVEIDKPLGLKLKESTAKGGGLVVEVRGT